MNKSFLAPSVSLMIFSLMSVPFIASAAIVQCAINPGDFCTICDLFVLGKSIIDFLLYTLAFPLAVIALLYGGFTWITSGGSPEKITKGKKAIESAVWGMVIAFGGWLIVDTILRGLVKKEFVVAFWENFPGCS